MKNIILNYDAFIFDMDGTIVDSLGVWEKIDCEFLEKKRAIKVPEDYSTAISTMNFKETADYTIKRFNLPDSPESLMEEWTEMAVYEYSHSLLLKDGVKEFFCELKKNNKKIALSTSSPEIFYKPLLINNGVYDLFDAFSDTNETGVGKKSPKVYLIAAEKCGAPPERCIVFEDVLEAAKTAKSAGFAVCGVSDGRSRVNKEQLKKLCDYYIEKFK
ncbi:MAG: HAD family phosphatase [Clostridia bacterium]|nr:HAD family phosphatase [Clostridia bacterium]